MVNSFNIPLINSEDRDIKKMMKKLIDDYLVFLYLPKNFSVYVENEFDEETENNNDFSNFNNQPIFRKIDAYYEEINEDFEDNSVMFGKQESYAIFEDTECKVKLMPVIKTFKFNLTLEIKTKSKVILKSCVNKIRERDAVIRKQFRHKDIETVCYLDNRIIMLLTEINKKRKLLYPNDEVYNYIKQYRTKSLVTVNSGKKDDNKNILGLDTNFSNIYSTLTTEANGLKIEYGDDKRHLLTLNFDIVLNMPISINTVYPSVIFNQPLNKKFVQQIDPYKTHVGEPKYIDEFDKVSRIQPELYTDKTQLYVNIPVWDRYIIPGWSNSFKRIFTVLLNARRDDNTKPLVNLKSISKKVSIRDEFIEFFLNGEYQYLTQLSKSVFQLQIFEDDKLVNSNFLSVDKDLNIYFSKDMDIKKLYRLSMSICVVPNILSKDAYQRAGGSTNEDGSGSGSHKQEGAADIINKLINNIIVINDIYNYDLYRTGLIDTRVSEKGKINVMKTVQTSYIQAAGFLKYKEEGKVNE